MMSLMNMDEYVDRCLLGDIREYASQKQCRTGYHYLDQKLTMYPGLYVLGALTSLGKTTFIHQMADQMAKRGNKILYFTFEQSRLELFSKSIARDVKIEYPDDELAWTTSTTIRQDDEDYLEDYVDDLYKKYAQNVYIVECAFSDTISTITEKVEDFISETQEIPVVIIDYLQVVKPDDPHASIRSGIDSVLFRLKRLQVDHKMMMFVISSINRDNYISQIDFESFKESGGIEYTADVVLGLQFNVINSPAFKNADRDEKRKMVRDAKLENPRMIELICLKNRYGEAGFSSFFKYDTEHDCFESVKKL